MAIDLGKQIGPLPLGAWVIVVGAGLGIAFYARKQSSATEEPIEVEDTSGTPGVGTGAVGGWLPTTPGTQSPVQGAPTTNEEWARAAIDHLIAMNYPPTSADAAIRKYIGGQTLSVSETALVSVALARLGSPPQPLPPTEGPPPGGGGGGGTGIPTAPTGIKVMPGKTVVQLDWGTVANAVRFEIQRIAPTPGTIVDTDGTEFLIHSLKPNTSYSFQLRSVGVNGKSGWTRVNTRTTK